MKYFNNKYLLITFLFLIQFINSKKNDDDDFSICGTDIKCSNKGGTCNEYNNNFYCTC